MINGSPPGKPQAMFALVTTSSRAMALPSRQMPKPSPRSALRSITMAHLHRRFVGYVCDVVKGDGQLLRIVADPLGDLDQDVQHVVPVVAEVQQSLGGLPELWRIALPEAAGD